MVIKVILSILFIIVFTIVCLLLQISIGKNNQKRKNLTDKEVKIDKKSLWIGFYFYLFLAIVVVVVDVFC